MDDFSDAEEKRRNAEMVRQRQETLRQDEELSRNTAEAARAAAETRRVAAAKEVNDTVANLTTLLDRMQAVETMRRTARGEDPK